MFWLLVACGSGGGPREDPSGLDPQDSHVDSDSDSGCAAGLEPLRGTRAARVDPRIVDAGQPVQALTFEWDVPVTLTGRGEDLDPIDYNAVVEFELPSGEALQTDEVISFTELNGDWRATAIDPDCEPVGLSVVHGSTYDGNEERQHSVMVLAPEGLVMGPGWRIRLDYTGTTPRRATDWHPDYVMRPHIRHRSPDAECEHSKDRGCFVELPEDDVASFDVLAGRPEVVRLHGPLDIVDGEQVTFRATSADAFHNPVPLGEVIQLDGPTGPVCSIDLRSTFSGTCTAPVSGWPAVARVGADVPGLTVAGMVTQFHVHEPRYRRLTGDYHVHASSLEESGRVRQFALHRAGDHLASSSHPTFALDWLREVAGYDFAAVSTHATQTRDVDPTVFFPADADASAFQPGGICYPGDGVGPYYDWWTPTQRASREFQEQHDDMVVFPAFEWHGMTTLDPTPLHRVVLFRDFDPADGLPFLAGHLDVPPQCLLHFMDLAAIDVTEALVIPHLMISGPANIDFPMTYDDPEGLALLHAEPQQARRRVDERHRLMELFSTHNPGAGLSRLKAFEGFAVSGMQAFDARMGFVAASDNHTQTPGVNEDDPGRYRDNQASGTTVVFAESADRDGIYDAMYARRTYGTSGTRDLLDVQIGGEPMGSETSTCEDTLEVRIRGASTRTIREVELVGVRRLGSSPTLLMSRALGSGGMDLTWKVNLPELGNVWFYYVRVWMGPDHALDDPDLHEEGMWSSPVWVDWSCARN